MTFLQRVLWLSRRNFLRGSLWNAGSIILIGIFSLVFFVFFLFQLQPNPDFLSEYKAALWLIHQLFAIILLVTFISLVIIFYLINRVRYHEIGVLRGIGARRRYIFFLILFEIQFLVMTGTLLAIGLGIVGFFAWSDKLVVYFSLSGGLQSWLEILYSLLLALVCTSAASVLAALYPALVISSIEPYSAIRNRE